MAAPGTRHGATGAVTRPCRDISATPGGRRRDGFWVRLVSRQLLRHLVRALMGISDVRIRILGHPPFPASCFEYGSRGRKMGLTHIRRSFPAAGFVTGRPLDF